MSGIDGVVKKQWQTFAATVWPDIPVDSVQYAEGEKVWHAAYFSALEWVIKVAAKPQEHAEAVLESAWNECLAYGKNLVDQHLAAERAKRD